ncbi:hypothetical protein Lal_00041796 [Lupinus albus]|nr:hypothetical protein Lal_00041796 [Lupinus albus]
MERGLWVGSWKPKTLERENEVVTELARLTRTKLNTHQAYWRFSPERERITWEGEILGYTGGFSPERELSRLGEKWQFWAVLRGVDLPYVVLYSLLGIDLPYVVLYSLRGIDLPYVVLDSLRGVDLPYVDLPYVVLCTTCPMWYCVQLALCGIVYDLPYVVQALCPKLDRRPNVMHAGEARDHGWMVTPSGAGTSGVDDPARGKRMVTVIISDLVVSTPNLCAGGGVDVYVLVSGCGKRDLCEISDQASGVGPVSAEKVRTLLRKRDRLRGVDLPYVVLYSLLGIDLPYVVLYSLRGIDLPYVVLDSLRGVDLPYVDLPYVVLCTTCPMWYCVRLALCGIVYDLPQVYMQWYLQITRRYISPDETYSVGAFNFATELMERTTAPQAYNNPIQTINYTHFACHHPMPSLARQVLDSNLLVGAGDVGCWSGFESWREKSVGALIACLAWLVRLGQRPWSGQIGPAPRLGIAPTPRLGTAPTPQSGSSPTPDACMSQSALAPWSGNGSASSVCHPRSNVW